MDLIIKTSYELNYILVLTIRNIHDFVYEEVWFQVKSQIIIFLSGINPLNISYLYVVTKFI